MWDRRGYSRPPIHAIAMSSAHRYLIDTASHLAGDAAFLRRWRVLLEQSAGPERIFQSPEFFDYMIAAGDEGAGCTPSPSATAALSSASCRSGCVATAW